MRHGSGTTLTVRRLAWRLGGTILCLCTLGFLALPAWPQQPANNLSDRSLEDLMNIQVTSVSKTKHKLSQTASAVFVITEDDIARSGATHIPDLLRMVPGVNVAQINANNWAISVRGFNERFSNSLLVLVDGRSVYAMSFGGVFWDALDVPLEDIERIEIIRGPGGSVWGANAVNGVINIITKKSSETRGALAVAGGGTAQQAFGTLQYGGDLGRHTDYRVFAKYLNHGDWPDFTGQNGGDGWHMLRGGFRMDSTLSAHDTLMVQGDMYSGLEGTPTWMLPSVTSPGPVPVESLVDISGGFLQGMWKHTHSDRSSTALELSYDRYAHDDFVGDHRGTLDLDFQHNFSWGERQNVTWGLEYRHSASRSSATLYAGFTPSSFATQLFGSYVQDEIAIVPKSVSLTIGTKLEHNDYTGFNLMPSARLAWTIDPSHMVWLATSHAVRTPSDVNTRIRANLGSIPGPGGLPLLLSYFGNPHADDEVLQAYEMGYRAQALAHLSIDLATFYNDYDHHETGEPASPFFEAVPAPPHLVLPVMFGNLMYGETHGIEIAANWKPISRWTLSPGYAFEKIHMHVAPTSQDTTSVSRVQGSSPDQSAQLRSHVVLTHALSWDLSAYFVGHLENLAVPSYTLVDTQLTWQFGEGASLSVVGQNLAQDLHEEFTDYTVTVRSTLVKRGVYAKLSWRF
jgi:iron complex outermembrane recepter protein